MPAAGVYPESTESTKINTREGLGGPQRAQEGLGGPGGPRINSGINRINTGINGISAREAPEGPGGPGGPRAHGGYPAGPIGHGMGSHTGIPSPHPPKGPASLAASFPVRPRRLSVVRISLGGFSPLLLVGTQCGQPQVARPSALLVTRRECHLLILPPPSPPPFPPASRCPSPARPTKPRPRPLCAAREAPAS